MDFLNHLLAVVPGPEWVKMSGIGLVVEFALHLIPSDKPMGIAHAASAAMHLVGNLCSKVASLLDAVIPQK